MLPFTQSRPFPRILTNGRSKHAARASRISKLGTTGMAKENYSVSTCWMIVAKSVQQASMTCVTCCMICSKKARFTTSPALAVSRLPRSSSPTSTMTTSLHLRRIPSSRRLVVSEFHSLLTLISSRRKSKTMFPKSVSISPPLVISKQWKRTPPSM